MYQPVNYLLIIQRPYLDYVVMIYYQTSNAFWKKIKPVQYNSSKKGSY